MVEVLGTALAFAFLGSMLVFTYRSLDKEKREIKRFRESLLRELGEINKSLRGEFDVR